MQRGQASLTLAHTEQGLGIALGGHWRLDSLPALQEMLEAFRWSGVTDRRIDARELVGLDSAGAMVLLKALARHGLPYDGMAWINLDAAHLALLDLVWARLPQAALSEPPRPSLIAYLGCRGAVMGRELRDHLAFLGRVGSELAVLLRHPGRFRPREFFVQLDAVGLGALGIVSMMTFLIGIVFAYLLGIQIEKYGANIFLVDGVAIALSRELGPLLTAVLIAGRSGAAFTAQIGAMKVTEEIDAIHSIGLSPVQVLVLPRLLAILITLPLLTFFGMVTGLLGASVVAAQLDITLHTFVARLQDVLTLDSVFFGLSKAPAYAAAIALIACRNGFAVSRDARSVGESTTKTVVQSLVAVILINAAFALASPEYRGE